MVLFLVVALGAGDAGMLDPAVRHEGAIDPPADPAPIDKLNGFQKAEWGMAAPKVRSLFPGSQLASKKPGEMLVFVPKTRVSGFDADLIFQFDKADRLKIVIVNFSTRDDLPREIFSPIRQALREKYGEPAREAEAGLGTSLLWMGERTMIGLTLDPLAIRPKPSVAIMYFSRSAFDEEQAKPAAPKSDDL